MDEFSKQSSLKDIEQRNPITITLLFYLVTAAAIVAACYRYIDVKSDSGLLQTIAASVIGAVIGAILGTIVLFRRSSHVWIAPLLGIAIGFAVGPLIRIRLVHFGSLLGISFLGSWILVVLMAVSARLDQRRSIRN